MFRRITVAASIAALVALSACGRGDETVSDTAVGAMATPPATTPGVGPTSTTTVGGTTIVIDSMGKTTSVTIGATTEVKRGTKTTTKSGTKTTKTPY